MEEDLHEGRGEVFSFPEKMKKQLLEVEKEIEERERILGTCKRTIKSEESEPNLTPEEISNIEKLKARIKSLEDSLLPLVEKRNRLQSQLG